jgi:CDP-diglyceride synthetase
MNTFIILLILVLVIIFFLEESELFATCFGRNCQNKKSGNGGIIGRILSRIRKK